LLCLPAGTIDHRDPGNVVLHHLGSAVILVEEILDGRRAHDFSDEFLTYWNHAAEFKGAPVFSLIGLAPPSRAIRLWNGRSFSLIADDDRTLKHWLDGRFGKPAVRTTEAAGLIWIGRAPAPFEFPRSGGDLRSLAVAHQAEAVTEELGSRGFKDAMIFLAAETDRGPALVGTYVSKPEREGQNALTRGFRPALMPQDVLLLRFFGGNRIERLSVDRADPAWIHGRDSDPRFARLHRSTVVIVGCGSVGAAVAVALAQAGVGRLILIDPDFLRWANVGRHPLGALYVGLRKASALASKLKQDFPHLATEVHTDLIESVLLDKPEVFDGCDLAVLATGQWSAEAMFDETRLKLGWTFPAVFGWTEAHACAGHAVAVVRGGNSFAFGFDATGLPLLRVAEWPGNTTLMEPACGGVYQPYGPIELGFVVNMIGELSIDCLLGNVVRSGHRVWAGRRSLLTQTGGRWTSAWTRIAGGRSEGGFMIERPWGAVAGSADRGEAA
jgi:sulfur-carrier protein adenylyltransferase/sulfurtransferase